MLIKKSVLNKSDSIQSHHGLNQYARDFADPQELAVLLSF